MTTLATNRLSEQRIRLATAAVVAAYINEISEPHPAKDGPAHLSSGPEQRGSRRFPKRSPTLRAQRRGACPQQPLPVSVSA